MEVQGSETPVRGGGPKVVSTPTQLRTAADTEVEAHTPSTARNRETEKQRNRESVRREGWEGGEKSARERGPRSRSREAGGKTGMEIERGARGILY